MVADLLIREAPVEDKLQQQYLFQTIGKWEKNPRKSKEFLAKISKAGAILNVAEKPLKAAHEHLCMNIEALNLIVHFVVQKNRFCQG